MELDEWMVRWLLLKTVIDAALSGEADDDLSA